jgi:hypothetical protein
MIAHMFYFVKQFGVHGLRCEGPRAINWAGSRAGTGGSIAVKGMSCIVSHLDYLEILW